MAKRGSTRSGIGENSSRSGSGRRSSSRVSESGSIHLDLHRDEIMPDISTVCGSGRGTTCINGDKKQNISITSRMSSRKSMKKGVRKLCRGVSSVVQSKRWRSGDRIGDTMHAWLGLMHRIVALAHNASSRIRGNLPFWRIVDFSRTIVFHTVSWIPFLDIRHRCCF